jgi:thiaminase/transcriptional activator TenA
MADHSFTGELRASCAEQWGRLVHHRFPQELAAGTLAPERLRFYLEQDVRYFLPAMARAVALGVVAAATSREMLHFAEELLATVGGEIESQSRLLNEVIGRGAEDRGGGLAAAPGTVAYTGHMVATAARGGPLEVMTALLPCIWSYGDIATAHAPDLVDHPIYSAWVRYYSSPEYEQLVAGRRAGLDRLSVTADDEQRARLRRIFLTSVRLEQVVWDMSYDMAQWPDLAHVAGGTRYELSGHELPRFEPEMEE